MTRNGRAYTPPKTRLWEDTAAALLGSAWGSAPPVPGPVLVEVVQVEARPQRCAKSLPEERYPCPSGGRHPDASNVLKAVEDALQKSRAILDDCQVVDARVRKVWAAAGEGPCVEVRIEEVTL